MMLNGAYSWLFQDEERKFTGLDFANMAQKFKRKRNQRDMRFWIKKTMNAQEQIKKYKDRIK